MEAATPLRHPPVRTVDDELVIDGLIVQDETAVRLARDREEAGEDAVQMVLDAIAIGARVLDREQVGANAEFVRNEFEKTARELDVQFTDKARTVAEFFKEKVDEVFDEDSGQLSREFEKLFSDGSSASVQNRVREIVAEAMVKSREDLVRQFSSADGTNPLADFKTATIRELREAHETQQATLERMGELEKQLQALKAEKEKLEELEEERERGSAKGRSFEEQVAEAIDVIADAQGDVAEAVGDLTAATGKTGDVTVDIDACSGPALGRIVFEAKNSKLTTPEARRELARGKEERDADFAVLVVPSEEKIPAKLRPLREFEGDKLVVTYDPAEGSTLALEVGYKLARARVLMKRAAGDGVDAPAVRLAVERALNEMEEVRRVKTQLTGAKTNIDNAYGLVETISDRVRQRLAEIDELVMDAAEPTEGEGVDATVEVDVGDAGSPDQQPELDF